MEKTSLATTLKDTRFLLTLIVLAFLCREVYLAATFPMLTGQDEARHYHTVQWLSEPLDTNCLKALIQNREQDKDDLATYRFSEEIRETSTAANLSVWREENYRKPSYTPGPDGVNEAQIQEQNWSKTTPICPPDIVSSAIRFSLFHWTASGIEHIFDTSDILTRFYLVRILAVLLGTLTIIFAYLATREAGFSPRVGLLIAFILSLQPRFSIYTTNINYDVLLIPCFALFVWAGIRYLQRGSTFTNIALLALAFGGAVFTKGTGLVLAGGVFFLASWTILTKRTVLKQVPLYYWLIGGAFVLVLGFLVTKAYAFSSLIPELSLPSLLEYLEKSIPRIPSSSDNFWGTISWNEATLGPLFVYLIWFIEAAALYGIIRFFQQKESLSFLPSKAIALFCLALLFSLQLGVRFHDWHVFQSTGALDLGTPGRYFLPTLLPQLIVLAIGLGALLRRSLWLERALILLALILLTFNLYTVWLIIIPRFYL